MGGYRNHHLSLSLGTIGIHAGTYPYSALHYWLDCRHYPAFIFILLVVMGIAALIAWFLRSLIKAIMLGWVDKIGGAVLGLILGALSISAILAIIAKVSNSSLITDSKFAGFFLDKFPLILKFLPGDFSTIRNFFK